MRFIQAVTVITGKFTKILSGTVLSDISFCSCYARLFKHIGVTTVFHKRFSCIWRIHAKLCDNRKRAQFCYVHTHALIFRANLSIGLQDNIPFWYSKRLLSIGSVGFSFWNSENTKCHFSHDRPCTHRRERPRRQHATVHLTVAAGSSLYTYRGERVGDGPVTL